MSVSGAHGRKGALGNTIDITIEKRVGERCAPRGGDADDPPEVANGEDAMGGKRVRITEERAV